MSEKLELRERAREMRERDPRPTHREIAATLSVSTSTVCRLLNPGAEERARRSSKDWKARNWQHKRAYDASYGRTHRGACLTCGGQMGIGMSKDGTCSKCVIAAKEERWRTIQSMWGDGHPLAVIAAALNQTTGHVGVQMAQMRNAGWDLPYRRAGNGWRR
ncbi:MAG: hypothetical protein ACRDK4_05100 [Solirubrobacteraceae bacterium]